VTKPKSYRLHRYTIRKSAAPARASEALGADVPHPLALAKALRAIFDDLPHDRESFVCVSIDARNRAIGFDVVAIGTMTGVEVHPREVFRAAILAGAVGICVAHNHPSGDPTPSPEDASLTQRLRDAGRLVGIPVLDHMVIGDGDRFYSFASRGAL
jgi:DNA repair protein RadC